MKKTKGSSKKFYAGIHLIADFWGGKVIEDEKEIEKILQKAGLLANNTPLKFIYHQFQPRGMTAVLLLKESHISLHSWPEWHYLAVDIFTCGKKTKPLLALKYLQKKFQPKRVEIKELKRGEKEF